MPFTARTAMTSRASLALMKFLADLAKRLGVAEHVYVVGGAVRNFVIDKPIKDLDVVIDAKVTGKARGKARDSEWFARQVANAIPAVARVETNPQGVALLHITTDWMLAGENLKGEDIEIANARKESYARSGDKPVVEPATLQEDVYRRDFTFNTLMWRLVDLSQGPEKAEILDITGCGLRDLQEGTMKCPKDPDQTFSDDPTRMLRAVKFIVKYGFKLPLDVERAIQKNAPKLRNISPSHLSNILIETFLRESFGKKALAEMARLGVLDVLKQIAQEDKSFRAALAGWADRESSVDFLFDMMDFGLPSGKRLSFLDRYQLDRVREITVHQTADEAARYVLVLQQPGKSVDTRTLMKEFSLKGKAVRGLMDLARKHLLDDPTMAMSPTKLTQRVREDLKGGKVAAEYHDCMPGGVADKGPPKGVSQAQVEKGIKVEMEHTDDREVAREIAYDHLTEDSRYYDKLESIEKHAAVTGDGTGSVGLFFRLPESLAPQFPSLGEADTSPPHVTFLYVGDVKGREQDFLEAVGFEVAANTRGPVQAVLQPLDYFVHPALDRRIALNRVRFSRDMGQLRDRIRSRLLDLGFEVKDGFPLVYQPHVTLQYMDGMDSQYEGKVPRGTWMVDEVEVWGLPDLHRIPFTLSAKTFTLDKGDPVLMGKYKNSPGRIEGFGDNGKGDPTVKIRKTPKGDKGRGSVKEVNLFKIRYDAEQAKKDKKAASRVAGRYLRASLRASLRQAGLFQPPPKMVESILEWVFSQVAANQIADIQAENRRLRKEHQDFLRSRMVRDFERSIAQLEAVVVSGGTREVHAAYQAFWDECYGMFGYGIPEYKQKAFTRIQQRRAEVVKMVSKAIKEAREWFAARNNERFIQRNNETIAALKKYRKTGTKPMKGGEVIKEFPLDLEDWYIGPERVQQFRDEALSSLSKEDTANPKVVEMMRDAFGKAWQTVKVRLAVSLGGTSRATWHPMKRLISVEVPSRRSPAALEASLRRSVEHELRHFGQSLMAEVLGTGDSWLVSRKPGPGFPSKQLLTPEYHQTGEKAKTRQEQRENLERHHLDDVEFYTDLADAIHRIRAAIEDSDKRRQGYEMGPLSYDERKAYFKAHVGLKVDRRLREKLYLSSQPIDSFFLALQRRAPGKYRKAVSEAWKELFGSSKMAASKFKNKKKVKNQKGEEQVVYEYSEQQVAHRHREKAKKVEGLRQNLSKLRSQVKKDLSSKDPKTWLSALAVGLMNDTYERVGNDTSAKDGHFGVTGWQAKHVTVSGGKATFSYVGKSGVEQKKTTSDAGLVKAVKRALEGKSGSDRLFEVDGTKVGASDVNQYLKPHGITAKDIRGLHANREMQSQLKAIRSKGGKLPTDKKEREQKLKDEFKKALEETAAAVGHEASTLRSQYLVPGLEDDFMRDGTVKTTLNKKGSDPIHSDNTCPSCGDVSRCRCIGPHPMTYSPCFRCRGGRSKQAIISIYNAWPDENTSDGPAEHVELDAFDDLTSSLTAYEWALINDMDRRAGEAEHILVWSDEDRLRKTWDAIGKLRLVKGDESTATDKELLRIVGKRFPRYTWRGFKVDEDVVMELQASDYLGPEEDGKIGLSYQFKGKRQLYKMARSPYLDRAARRLTARWFVEATKSEGEKEQEEVERLNRRNPTKKPPRKDLRRNRVEMGDKDTAGTGADGDRDLSLNYKKVASRLSDRFLRMHLRVAKGEGKHKPGDPPWKTDDGKWVSMNPDGNTQTFGTDDVAKARAEAFSKGREFDEGSYNEEKKKEENKQKKEQFKETAQAVLSSLSDLPSELRQEVEAMVRGKDKDALFRAFQDEQKVLMEGLSVGYSKERVRDLARDPFEGVDKSDPKALGPALVRAVLRERLLLDPSTVGGKKMSDTMLTDDERVDRARDAFRQYRHVPPEMRQEAAVRAAKVLDYAKPGSPEHEEMQAIINGLHMAAILRGEKLEAKRLDGTFIRDDLGPKLNTLVREMVAQSDTWDDERFKVIFSSDPSRVYQAEGRQLVRDAVNGLDDASLAEMSEGTPWGSLAEHLGNPEIDPEVQEYLRQFMGDMMVTNMTTIQGVTAMLSQGKAKEDPSTEAGIYDTVMAEILSAAEEDVTSEVDSSLKECLESGKNIAECLKGSAQRAQKSLLGAAVAVALTLSDKFGISPDQQSVPYALARSVSEGADLSILDEQWEAEKPLAERKREYLQNLEDPEERSRVENMSDEDFIALERNVFGVSGGPG